MAAESVAMGVIAVCILTSLGVFLGVMLHHVPPGVLWRSFAVVAGLLAACMAYSVGVALLVKYYLRNP